MKNEKELIAIQLRLFGKLQKIVAKKHSLVAKIADLLNMSESSVYRRINGKTLLKIEEMRLLCIQYHISFDWLMGIDNAGSFEFHPLDLSNSEEVYNRATALQNNLDKIKNSAGLNFTVSAMSIPIFYFAAHKELLFFKLFTWYRGIYGYKGSLSSFINEANTQKATACFQKIYIYYEHTPSSEIWTDDTIDSILKAIAYHWSIRSFPDRVLPLQLCQQLLTMLEQLEEWVKTGTKGSSRIPFQFYLCEMSLGNDIIMVKNSEFEHCTIKLFTMNGLKVTNHDLCNETSLWLTRVMQSSVLLSCNAERERLKFFNNQRQKVEVMIKKIEAER